MNREANRKMLSATSESGSSKTTGRPLLRQVGTRRLDGIRVSTWSFITRSTSLGSRPTRLSARFRRTTPEPFAWHTDREQEYQSAFERCLTPRRRAPL